MAKATGECVIADEAELSEISSICSLRADNWEGAQNLGVCVKVYCLHMRGFLHDSPHLTSLMASLPWLQSFTRPSGCWLLFPRITRSRRSKDQGMRRRWRGPTWSTIYDFVKRHANYQDLILRHTLLTILAIIIEINAKHTRS